ncbi:MAG: hypothetical protein JWM52_116 [Candidatus Saccharibacteria bacterium]|nr:hypothetical protein [Candidatus Saccharibacteria bacterium]
MAKPPKRIINSFIKRLPLHAKRFAHSSFFQKSLPYLFILIVGIISCLPLFSSSVPFGDDLLFHAYRYKGTIDALLDGQIIPQVDPQALYGFGHSWNIFYGPLITYLAALLHVLSLSWPVIINITVILSVLLSGVFMYRYIREVSNNTAVGVIAATLYMTAPYHLFDIYSRQAGGEIFGFIFIPLVFHGLWKIINSDKKNRVLLLIVGATGLILTHNLSAALVAVFSVIYLACSIRAIRKSWKRILKDLTVSCFAIVGLSAFFLLPLLEAEHVGIYNIFDPSYTSVAMGINAQYLNSWRVDYLNFIFNPAAITDYSDTKPFALGTVSLLAFALLFVSYRRIPRAKRSFVIVFTAFSLLAILLCSKFINWSHMPHLLLDIQFPWRFLFIAIFFIAIVSAYSLYYSADTILTVFKKLNSKIKMIIVAGIVVLIAVASIMVSGNIIQSINSGSWWTGDYNYSSTDGVGGGEYLPATSAIDDKKEIETRIQNYLAQYGREARPSSELIKIDNYKEDGTKTDFDINASTTTDQYVTLPYIYYPGYKADYTDMDGHHKHLTTGPSIDGFLNIYVSGEVNGNITTKYGMSKGTLVGASISLLTLCVIVITFRLKRKHIRQNTVK